MMYNAQTIDGNYIDLGQPIEVQIDRSNDAPADCMSATFPINKRFEEFKSISVCESEKKIFFGPVDTQKTKCSSSGTFLNISARSIAALLLDNEACPQIYCVPSLLVIFNRHIRPYGFSKILGDSRTFPEEFIISKGMSEWEVLETFCSDYLRVYPRVLYDNTINATGNITSDNVFFTNIGTGIKYSSISENIKRCKLYSEIYVRDKKEGTYSLCIKDENTIAREVNTKRYLNAVDDVKTPIICGELMLKSARRNAYEITLTVPGAVNIKIGDTAYVDDKIFGNISNLVISKIKYTLNATGEKTEVTMQRGDF